MPQERGYEARTMPQAAAPLPLASARTYGGELADAIGEAGQDLHRREIRAYQVQRQMTAAEESARSNRDFAQFRIGHTEWQQGRQAQGFEGYAGDVLKHIEDARAAAKEGVTEDGVRQAIDAKFDAFGVMEHERATAWEQGQRIATDIVADEATTDAVAAMLKRDPSRTSEELGFALAAIEERRWEPRLKAEQTLRVTRKYYAAAGEALALTNPAQLQEEIAAGKYDLLGPGGVRALENLAQGTAGRQMAQVREDIRTLEARRENGEVFPAETWAQAAAQAEAMGDRSWAEKLRQRGEDAQLDDAWGPMTATPLQRQKRMSELAAKGDGRTQPENRLFKYLQENSPKFAAWFDRNSMGFMIERGGIAPIDWNDPKSLARRSRDRRAAAASAGREVAFASDEEIAPLRDQYATGQAGQGAVLRQLDGIADDMDRDRAARQIAPEDANFRHLAQVRPQQRDMVVRGQQAIAANPQLLKVDPNADRRKVGEKMAAIEGELRLAFRGMPPEYAEQAVQTAREYMAGTLWNKGAANIVDAYSEGSHRDAVRVALGGFKMGNAATPVGGVGHWAEKGDRPYVIADGFSEPGFEMAVERDRLRQSREGRQPVDRDGKTPFDLKNAWPVMVRPGVYRWETRGGIVKNARGEDFVSFVRAGE